MAAARAGNHPARKAMARGRGVPRAVGIAHRSINVRCDAAISLSCPPIAGRV